MWPKTTGIDPDGAIANACSLPYPCHHFEGRANRIGISDRLTGQFDMGQFKPYSLPLHFAVPVWQLQLMTIAILLG